MCSCAAKGLPVLRLMMQALVDAVDFCAYEHVFKRCPPRWSAGGRGRHSWSQGRRASVEHGSLGTMLYPQHWLHRGHAPPPPYWCHSPWLVWLCVVVASIPTHPTCPQCCWSALACFSSALAEGLWQGGPSCSWPHSSEWAPFDLNGARMWKSTHPPQACAQVGSSSELQWGWTTK